MRRPGPGAQNLKPKGPPHVSNRVMAVATASPFPSLGRFEISLFAFVHREWTEERAPERLAGVRSRSGDEPLVQQARLGDQDSFRILVERHGDAAYALSLRIVQSPQDAEEVAQDAFVRAWRALPQFRGESSFSTWLYRIVTRRAFVKAAAARRKRAMEEPLDERAIEALPDPHSPREVGRTRLRLERLIAGLSDMQRAVVTLFYLQDRSLRDVAGILDLPLGTVKTHLHRSRAALRGAWAREVAGEKKDELRGF